MPEATTPTEPAKATAPQSVPVNTNAAPTASPFHFWNSFRDELDSAFGRFSRSLLNVPALWHSPDTDPLRHFEGAFGMTIPAVDITEREADYQITAELPGIETKDISVSLADNVLTLKGEKTISVDEKRGDVHLTERRYGSFRRSFHVPSDTDVEKISAAFDKGILTVTLPKAGTSAKQERTIPIAH
ncbi:Hsp20/alpha crystallin family protein [Nitrospirillum viridazoti]|uniref:HSP20 family protein n=1 Tax=Nitrospirillum amazonense TaxID=28077 RepID=A0A560IY67_9PROT|nr:Hsp20/alpha crystallin family protein [Nitrospirillum amazonense]TWB63958.1 HSP20 family protein [Nitrospirillum amazonense]